jgi:acetate kinase
LVQVACFDTAFHHTMPAVEQTFALPPALAEQGVRPYGFHGLSYEYVAGILPQYLHTTANGRVIVAHLGHGASLCAMYGGKSVATTMTFTPLDGLPMATRCGSIDPSVILYLMRERGMDAGAVSELLHHQSGLLGVSGISGDMRELLVSDAPMAAQAVDLFVHHVNRQLGSLAAALGGLDALVFTAGIGEHAPTIRERICLKATWLGVRLDESANATNRSRISTAGSPVSAWVIPTNEELIIARHTQALVRSLEPMQ